jgi:hypothetical protein
MRDERVATDGRFTCQAVRRGNKKDPDGLVGQIKIPGFRYFSEPDCKR